MRPPVVRARLQNVDLVVCLRTVLRFVQRAVRTEIDALRIAMTVGEDVAPHACDLRIVVRNRAVEIQPQRLPHVRGVVLRLELRRCRQPLRFDRNAVVAELIVSLVADRVVQLAIRPDLHPAGLMVVARGQSRDERDRIAQRLLRPVVCKAHDLRVEKTIRARGGPRLVRRQTLVDVRVARIDDVVVQVERQAHQPVLPSRRAHLIDRDRDFLLARRRIHAGDALACALGHPQHVVRAPRHLERPGESGHHFALAELLRSAHHGLRPILRDQAHKYDQAAHDGGNNGSHSASKVAVTIAYCE